MRPATTAPLFARRVASLLLAVGLMLTTLALPTIPASAADDTFADDFQSFSFSGDTGSLSWPGPWAESGEADGATSGSIQVGNEPNCEEEPCLLLGRSSGPDAAVEREVDLSPFASAQLTFNYKIHDHFPGAGTASLDISSNGGLDWTTLEVWSLASPTGHRIATYDISDFITTESRIRFSVAGSTDDSHMNVDNVEISVAGTTCYMVGEDGGTYQLTSLDLSEPDPLAAEITIGDTDTDIRSIAVDPATGNLFAATTDQLHLIDPATAAVTTIGLFGSSGPTSFDNVETLALDPTTGVLYASHNRPGDRDLIIQVDPGTGSVVPDAFGPGIDFVVFDSDKAAQKSLLGLSIDSNGQMWGMGWDDNSQEKIHTIDKQTGAANDDGGSSMVAGLSFDSSGTLWGIRPAGEVFDIHFEDNVRSIDNLSNYMGVACEPPGASNRPPTFNQDLGDRTDTEGTLVWRSAAATDPDGDGLTYSATDLPDGVSIDPGSGMINGAFGPNSSGIHNITITVTDDGSPSLQDTDSFIWTVAAGEVTYLVANSGGGNGGDDQLTVVNRDDPNPFTNEVDIGTGTGTWNIEAIALQPGSNTLYAVENDQLGSIDVTTGVFTARPSIAGAGNGSVGLTAFDNIEGLSFNPFTGELFGTHRRGTGEEDLLFRFDPATGSHIPNAFAGADYVVVEKQYPYHHAADIAFDPTDGQMYVIHWDIAGNWTIATLDPVTGATTTIGAAPDDITSLSFDAAGRLYTSTESGWPEWLMELDKTDGTSQGAINIDNGTGYEAMAISFPIDPNRPPLFDQDLLDRSEAEGTTVSQSAAATDPDGSDNLTYAATGLPPGLTIDTGTGLIAGTIGFAAGGSYPVEITVTDNGIPNLGATDVFTWTVSDFNQPPSFDQDLPDRDDAEGTTIALSAAATDPDGSDKLTYGAIGLPPGLSIDTTSGLIEGTLDYSAALGSPYDVTVTVTDDGVPSQGATPDTFTWAVTNTNRPPVMTSPGAQTTPELALFSLGLSATDPDGEIPAFSEGGTLPSWAVLTDNGDGTATITGTPGVGDSGTTTVVVTASDGGTPDLSDGVVFDVTVTNTNVPPTVTDPGDQTVAENDPFNLTVTSSDPDGTIPSIAATGLPGWAAFVDNGDGTATITGTPGYTDAATTTVTITASDGTLTGDAIFDLTVTNTNRPPVADPVTDQTVAEGTALTPVVVTASDPDGTIPSIAATGLPGWAAFVDNGDGTGTISGTPGYTDAATTTVTITASDGTLTADTVFDLTVTNTNRPPVADPVTDQTVAEGTALTPVVVTASDPDGTIPTLTASGLPGWATLVDNGDGTAIITGTPSYNDAGLSTITITASDGTLTGDTVFDLTVTNTNQPPTAGDVPDQTDAEGATISVSAAGSDPDHDTISYSATGLPPGLAMDSSTGLISGTITYAATFGSPYAVVITLVDAGTPSYLATDTFVWTVINTNRPPVFDADLPDRTDAEGAAVSVNGPASDPDLDTIAYSATGLPPGVTIDAVSGVISGTISATAASDSPYTVEITATDDGSPRLSTVDAFTWTVTDTNQPPRLSPIADQLGDEQTLITFTAAATDPDLDDVVFSLSGQPSGASIDPESGVFSWTPTEADGIGSFAVTVIATDTGSPVLTDSRVVTITVVEVNRPPEIMPIGDQADAVGNAISLAVAVTDPDIPTNALTFTATGLPPGLSIDPATGVISGIVGSIAVGNHAVEVTVEDDGTPRGVGHIEFMWRVTDTNQAPVFEFVANQTVAEGSEIEFEIVANDPDGDMVSLSLGDAPDGAEISRMRGRLSWTPSEEHGPGSHRVSIVATDDGSPRLSKTLVVTINVTEVNQTPELAPIANRADEVGADVSIRLETEDPDLPAQTLTFSATGLPDGVSIDPVTGAITGRIGDRAAGEHQVVVTVIDDITPAGEATAEFTWVVAEPADIPDTSPLIEPIAEQYSTEGATVSLQVVASGLGELVYEASGLPPGLVVDVATGLVSGAIAADSVGSHRVTISVSSAADVGSTTTVSFYWVVTDVAAAEQKDDLVVALEGFADPSPAAPESEQQAEPRIRRTLVVMGGVASATTEALSMPFALLLILLLGFVTMGRIGLYPLLWRGDRHRGTITLYDQEMDFGLIEPDGDGEAVFVHANAFPRRQRATLRVGTRVRYRLLASDNRANAWGATTEGGDG